MNPVTVLPLTAPLLTDPPDPEPAPTPLPTHLLVDIAEGLASAQTLWEPHLDVAPDRRGHVRLVATDTYEAWLITWPVGHGVDLHDHGGSVGVIAVADGALVEIEAAGEGRFRSHTVRADETRVVPADRIHDVVNTGSVAAVSVHVYSPPLQSMTFFGQGPDEDGLRPVRTEYLYPEQPSVPVREASVALHPSARVARRVDA